MRRTAGELRRTMGKQRCDNFFPPFAVARGRIHRLWHPCHLHKWHYVIAWFFIVGMIDLGSIVPPPPPHDRLWRIGLLNGPEEQLYVQPCDSPGLIPFLLLGFRYLRINCIVAGNCRLVSNQEPISLSLANFTPLLPAIFTYSLSSIDLLGGGVAM